MSMKGLAGRAVSWAAPVLVGMCLFAGGGGAAAQAPAPPAGPAPVSEDPLRALGMFLMALGELDDPARVAECPFDGNGKDKKEKGNGIPDAAEFTLLAEVLRNPRLEMGALGGVSHTQAAEAYRANLARAAEQLGDPEGAARRPWLAAAVAGYMTLDAWNADEFLEAAVRDIAGLKVRLDDYETSQLIHLPAQQDADNDAVTNREEWEYTRSVSGTAQEFARRCLDPEVRDMLPMVPLDSLRCWNDDPNDPGPNAGFLRMDTSNGGLKFNAWVKLDPDGRGIELPEEAMQLGAQQDIIRAGRLIELRLVPGQNRPFDHWSIPGTMGDRSFKKRVVFTFIAQNGPDLMVRAVPR
ncbi:MAG TPA: hypothetical protein PKL54_02700 [Candidatus Hydrogenedentes bacterium]|nr:hypothetical protein [Candidatus Hydrogenedentota bacterium]